MEDVRTDSAVTHFVWIGTKDIASQEKIRAAFTADRNRRSQEEQDGITNLFVSLLDVDPSRSEMARSLIFHIPLPNSLGTPHPLER